MAKYCFSFNDLAVYREAIYLMMDKEFDADWYIEDIDTHCKEFESSKLKHVYALHTIRKGSVDWIRGFISLLWKKYDKYLFLGQSNNLSLYFFVILKRIFFRDKKVFLWTHGWYGKETRTQALLKKWLFNHVDGTFVYGDYAIRLMKENGIDGDKLWPIHNSLNYDEQLRLRNQLTISPVYKDYFKNSNPVLIMIGRLTLRKHLDLLIRAVASLKEKGYHYNVIIIGDGEDKSQLQSLASNLGISDAVWFYGACYDEKVNAELLYNADMCVVPGDIGLTAIHSMMFGVPCLTHNKLFFQGPEFEAIKEGITGSFYDYLDPNSLSEKIVSWFVQHQSNREVVRNACFDEIDTRWNPYYQIEVLKAHI